MSDYMDKLGFPGAPPFTRGIHPTMYPGRLWTMRQYSGYATAAETNRRYRYLLRQGQTGLSVAFDLPTQMGYDSDDPMSDGEVGKSGVAIDSIRDMETLFEAIPLDAVSVSMTINASASVILAMVVATAEKRGIPARSLSGTVQNDILKEFVARGCYIYPPEPSLRLAVDVMEHTLREAPRWNPISISGYHIREAGSTAAQELGLTLANGICYVEEAAKRGIPLDALGRRISFFFNAHNNFLEEIAKFRAARRLWDGIMRNRFGVADDKARMMRFHVQTAGSTLTAQQPENNAVRVTLQAMAAVLGGAQSLHTNALDEALCLPTESAAKLALRTQQIVALETGVADVIDPLGGAAAVEEATDRLEAEAKAVIAAVDGLGGAVAAIKRGYYQTEIEKSALQYQRDIENDRRVVVGVNKYQETEDVGGGGRLRYLKIDLKAQEDQRRRLADLKAGRDRVDVRKTLDNLRRASEGKVNMMAPIVECVKAGATLGEICGAMAEFFGRHRPV